MTFARTQIDAVLVDGYEPTQADWQDLDRKQQRAINGDKGGAWAPNALLTLKDLQVTGPSLVAYGGELRTASTGRFYIKGSSGNWPAYAVGHPHRSRRILCSLLPRLAEPETHWILDQSTAGVRSVGLAVQDSDGRLSSPSTLRCELRVHDGATLTEATICFRVSGTRSKAPLRMPRFRIVRQDADGLSIALKSTAPDVDGIAADVDGFASPTKPTSGAPWANDGLAQTFVYRCDQNNIIAVDTYAYFIEIVEEVGALAPVAPGGYDGILVRERKRAVRLATTSLITTNLTGNISIDGSTTAAGDRILVKNQISNNPLTVWSSGIWIASASAWSRALDCDTTDDFTPGFFVEVESGTLNRGTFWECSEPRPYIMDDANPGTGWPINFQRLAPSGNTYHSVALDFESIADMRFP